MEKYSCQYFFHFHPKKSPVEERLIACLPTGLVVVFSNRC
jgi:hypothetical protein